LNPRSRRISYRLAVASGGPPRPKPSHSLAIILPLTQRHFNGGQRNFSLRLRGKY